MPQSSYAESQKPDSPTPPEAAQSVVGGGNFHPPVLAKFGIP